MILCLTFYWCQELDRGIAETKRAIELNPNNAQAHSVLGHGLTLSGQPKEGISYGERGIRLGPRDPRQAVWMWFVGVGHLTAHQYGDAVEWSERAIQRHPKNPDAHLCLASSLGHLGRVEDARAALDSYRRLIPETSQRPHFFWHYKNESDHEHFLVGLRTAGWEG